MSSLTRPFIYPHRSQRIVPLKAWKLAGATALASALMAFVWIFGTQLIEAHNEIVLRLCRQIHLVEAHPEITSEFGRVIEIITVPSNPNPLTLRSTTSAVVFLVVIGLFARRFPLARGLITFLVAIVVFSLIGALAGAPALANVATFAAAWVDTEFLVWLLLPAATMCLFVVLQPSLARGALWMVGIEAFAVVWSAVRFVVLLGVGHYAGVMLLPLVWFAWGLLTDVVSLIAFYSWSIHVTLALSKGR
jgi:hypothetical protein